MNDLIKKTFRFIKGCSGKKEACCRESEGQSGCSGCEEQKGPVVNRRQAISIGVKSSLLGATAAATTSCGLGGSEEDREKYSLQFQEYIKENYRLMTDEEKEETVKRLERLYELKHGLKPRIGTEDPIEGVLYGYAFNISKCKGYRECVKACVMENNQDRASNMQYIRIYEVENGKSLLHDGNPEFNHTVPAAGHFYQGVQCFQCENPPCVDVCPVGATWKEKDGIVVVDQDWCIGCRYCQAACPYWARRFNWSNPTIPKDEVNLKQHYLSNRPRKAGVMEKCTFCLQRSRKGENPACVEACPTGARIFGNLLDPSSEIRWVLKNKKVFRLKEELQTDPKFWYFTD